MDFGHIIEEKIKQSIARGDFDHLPGKGKPLPMDELAYAPDDMRNSYRILKNANMLPEEMQIKKEIVQLEDLLIGCHDPKQQSRYKQQLSEKRIRFNLLMEKRKWQQSGAYRQYQGRIDRRFGF
ncbi:DnaJ family domain-containing protein [Halobacillus amylolyticus]|uniref:DUF1992 domain-containing protein n=1 Tax=Halobacillus amylolyticus TaxID=2932259 RepID=A0ABY4HIY6_9BACI|nr:DUF1992 domain-containing protein [Halobacillus amylolyticus]UOR13430.1 DUF1992 domain-containing protein [Halobacillus amylolyticus]